MQDACPSERLDALLDEILAVPDEGQHAAMERCCAANPTEAEALRRRFQCLVHFGLCSTNAPALLTGSELGGYRLGELLGCGGMGSVYFAERLRDGAPCALKVLHKELQHLPKARDRLLREGRIAGELRHRNLCEVLDVGDDQGTPFLVMQLVRGDSLAQRLQRDPAELSGSVEAVARTVAATGKIARALGVLHARGLVHRDVKPANVVLDGEGEPVLVDFGLARETESETLTVSGTPLGTPAYMPPEQVRGEHDVTPAADVYALGATLFECLAQRPPFTAGDRQTLFARILADDPPNLMRANRFVDKHLFAIVCRCLQKRPELRYVDGNALADDLQAIHEGRRPKARLPSLLQQTGRWGHRHPIAVLSAVAAALAIALGLVLVVQVSRQARAQAIAIASDSAALDELNPVAGALLAREAFRLDRTYATRSRLLAALANLAQVGEVQIGGTVGWFGYSPDGNRLACGVAAFGSSPTTPSCAGAAPPRVVVGTGHAGAWCADGSRFAIAGANRLRLYDGVTGKLLGERLALPARVESYGLFRPAPVLQFDGEGRLHLGLDDGRVHSFGADLRDLGSHAVATVPIRWLGMQPGGGLAVLTDQGTIVTLDASWNETQRVGLPVQGQVSCVSGAVGSPWLAFGTTKGVVLRAWLGPEVAIDEVGIVDGEVTATVITDDGSTVAASSNARTLLLRRGDGKVAVLPHACNSVPTALALAGDGSSIALGDHQGVVRVFDAGLSLGRRLAGHLEVVNSLSFVAAGRLASSSWDGSIRYWDLRAGPMQQLVGAEGTVFVAAWHPDRRHVLGIDFMGRLLLWNTDGQLRQECPTRPTRSGVAALAISADGERVATAGHNNELRFWVCRPDLEPPLEERERGRNTPAASTTRELRFARDGTLFVGNNTALAIHPVDSMSQASTRWPHDSELFAVDLSSTEDEVAIATRDGRVVLLDRQCQPFQEFSFECAALSVAFVPASRFLTVGLGNGDIVRIDRDSEARSVWRGHDGIVRRVVWSPDGAHLLSGGSDGTVRLWQRDGTPVCELPHPGVVHCVAFSPDGQRLLSAGSDGVVRIWPLPVGDLEALSAWIFRDFTPEERQRFAPLLR